jgi:hypothetical protein
LVLIFGDARILAHTFIAKEKPPSSISSRRFIMKTLTHCALFLLALTVVVGCASTEVVERHSKIGSKKIAKPDRIYVYPFASVPEDVPSWSQAAGKHTPPSKPPTPEELKVGREIGDLVAQELVTEIVEMGMVALKGDANSQPRPNDLLITGYFESVEEGSTIKRVGLGFGSGATELTTSVEGYQMTEAGPRLLGSGKLEQGGGKTPGLIVPIAVHNVKYQL